MSVIINSYFTRLSISDFDGLLSRCPSFQLRSGYEFLRSLQAFVMLLPPDVANGIIVLPFRLLLSMKELIIVGTVYHHIGKPMYTPPFNHRNVLLAWPTYLSLFSPVLPHIL